MKKHFLNLFRLSKWEYFADFFVTTPLTLVVAAVSVYGMAMYGGWSASWVMWLIVGGVAWTFYEYATHRWLLHGAWFFRDMHEMHHRNQRDYIALHPVGTITLYSALWSIFGFQSSAFMVGFSVGYLIYSALHTAFHYAKIVPGHWLHNAKRRHLIHHTFANTYYGVTTPLWDRVFGTTLRRTWK